MPATLTPPELDDTPEAKVAEIKPKRRRKKKAETKKPKEASARRSKFAELYPRDMPLTVLVEANPKQKGSKARERFEAYWDAETVGDALDAGATYQDLAYNIGRQFVKVG